MGYCCVKQNIIAGSHWDSNAERGKAEVGNHCVIDSILINSPQINLRHAHGEIIIGMTTCKNIAPKCHCTKIFSSGGGIGIRQSLEGDPLLRFDQLVDNCCVSKRFKGSLGTFAADPAIRVAAAIEQSARQQMLDDLDDSLASLTRELESLSVHLKKIVAGISG